MKKLLYLLTLPATALVAWPANAVCPVCVVAVGAGLGLSEYLGIDDTIAGVWIGGLLAATTVWTINWLNRKKILEKYKKLLPVSVAILYYALTFWPLWLQDLVGSPTNRFWGVDKLILGTIFGSLGLLAAAARYEQIKKKRGRAHFPFQKVAMPVGALIILSALFYFLTR